MKGAAIQTTRSLKSSSHLVLAFGLQTGQYLFIGQVASINNQRAFLTMTTGSSMRGVINWEYTGLSLFFFHRSLPTAMLSLTYHIIDKPQTTVLGQCKGW